MMADHEATTTEPPKRRGGWPKGKPRPSLPTTESVQVRAPLKARPMMKSRPNWEGEDFVGVGFDGSDRLKIPDDVIQAIHRDGFSLQWVTKSVRGQEAPQELSKMTRGGWTPVHQSDFSSLLDGMFMPKGQDDDPITVDDCLLVARPVEIHSKAKMLERREARRPLQIAEEQLGHGIPGVTGSDHPTAVRQNAIKTSMERVEIPE